jgi:hypothetical protein
VKASAAPQPVEIPDDDPIVQQIIEASIAPYRDRVSPEILEDMEEVLLLFLTTHPEAVRAVDSLRPRAVRIESGQVVRDSTLTADVEPATQRRASGDDR